MMLLAVLLAQAMPPVKERPREYMPPANVRCIQDSFGNHSCTDGSRVVRDSFGNVTVIPPRRK